MKGQILCVLLLWVGSCPLAAAGPATIPWDRVPGVKAADFKPDFLAGVAELLEKTACYGRCTQSIASCLRVDPPSPTAARLARDVFMLMASEASVEDVAKWVEMRKRMAHPKPTDVRGIRLDGLTPLGEAKAPVTIVEYSDFQCPFCAMISPILEKMARESQGKASLYFKQFPIKGHPRALIASKACVASDKFGKFWTYCPKLFANQADLSDENIMKLAAESGMELKAFKKQMESDEVLNRIADEKMEGLKNRIKGTPTIFVNGKEFLAQPTPELLRDRIAEELDILNGRD